MCLTNNHNNNIVFVNDTIAERNACILKHVKNCDRIVFIDYGISVDDESLRTMIDSWNFQCVVYPCVKPGIDWEMFKEKVKKGSLEPIEQKGLHFDTDVGRICQGDYYWVNKTEPKLWVAQTKHLAKQLKNSKTVDFSSLKVCAYTPARVICTYPHECIGNILGAAGVKQN